MKRAQRACSESMKIDRRMAAFAGSGHTMKFLLRIASPGIENRQAKIFFGFCQHRQLCRALTR
jgi:hypothetical protein